ncbi:MAG TPA: biopolymer transporter ExbD [Pirellulales bacterium]|nr:biopolymer transporter ExbD [Pirellulales bacterium]
MKIRKSAASGNDKVEMQMTPMIDIVFQLLTFFVMSFKIAVQEGDFNVKMPLAAASSAETIEELPPIKLRLTANEKGQLSGIHMGERSLPSFKELNAAIIELVGTDSGPSSLAAQTEVEIDADYDLRYENVVEAITAISGYVDKTGHIVKLIEKLKFVPPKPGDSP